MATAFVSMAHLTLKATPTPPWHGRALSGVVSIARTHTCVVRMLLSAHSTLAVRWPVFWWPPRWRETIVARMRRHTASRAVSVEGASEQRLQ
jgi:hypothetical protein